MQENLDPENWDDVRSQGHRMLDDMFDYLQHIRQRPVWQNIPKDRREKFRQALPATPSALSQVHNNFMQNILPYSVGNAHPGFMGWVHGGGTVVGMLAEMLAAGLNSNVGGRDQIPIEVERQILKWMQQLFAFPDTASGLFVSGTSTANLISLTIARAVALGRNVRQTGLNSKNKTLTAYTSTAAHSSIAQAMDLAGLGTTQLRAIATNELQQMDIELLRQAIEKDRCAGLTPFLIAGTAGTVNSGAIDNLNALADIAKDEKLWFHIDGAYGALAMLSPDIAPRLAGIERADSIAFDFHKWLQVPYDAGFIIVRDSKVHLDSFSSSADYLQRTAAGMAGGSPWPCDFSPELSRSFRALKVWFTINVYGTKKLGQMISTRCQLAQYLEQGINTSPALELLAPVSLNILCFRYRSNTHHDNKASNELNAAIVTAIQESGIAAPSSTVINGQLAIRAAIFNHRTSTQDLDALLAAVLKIGQAHGLLLTAKLRSNEPYNNVRRAS